VELDVNASEGAVGWLEVEGLFSALETLALSVTLGASGECTCGVAPGLMTVIANDS
jgi:hypothetical protein